ncbi:MAG: Hsp70 family protein [Acidobacteriota bacterium]|nr:Hsp70 family protein [Acidobacteriota bacterium]
MSIWSLDLGSHNSAVARWNGELGRPEMLHLSEISRREEQDREIEVKFSIPSVVYALKPETFKDRLGQWSPVAKRFFLGRQAYIGRQALDRDQNHRTPELATAFKPFLLRDHFRTLARLGGKALTARDVTRLYLRELLAEIKRQTGERIRHLAVGTPVDCYEPYRAQLKHIGAGLGISRMQFVDEPVAAALGYGISAGHRKPVLVIDFGAGTLDLAIITMGAEQVAEGHCSVLAKSGAAVGGNHVDSWLLELFCEQKAFNLDPAADMDTMWWYRAMMAEARAVKERLFLEEETYFYMEPPESLHQFEALLRAQGRDLKSPLPIRRDELTQLLTRKGLYRMMNEQIDIVLEQAAAKGASPDRVSEVLMVGGSTLLPGIYPLLEKRFGRDKVRAWQPFHAVAYGAAAFASGVFDKSDFITHDYAVRTYNPKTHDPEHQLIIPRGTPFPTKPDFWKRRFTPTCALGEPESIFKLIICELGGKNHLEQEFVWDPDGRLHALGQDNAGDEVIIPLNEDNPTLGYMDPPHAPSDRAARLEISFGVNEDRRLIASVYDLKTRKHLMKAEAIVRIL